MVRDIPAGRGKTIIFFYSVATVSKAFICTTVKRNNKREGRKVARIAMLANEGKRNGDNSNFNRLNVVVFFNCMF